MTARQIAYPHAFLTKNGMSNNSAHKMLSGSAVQVNFRQLTSLCVALNCTPNDLFALRDLPLPENHQLKIIQDITDPVINPRDFYKDKSFPEIKAMDKDADQQY